MTSKIPFAKAPVGSCIQPNLSSYGWSPYEVMIIRNHPGATLYARKQFSFLGEFPGPNGGHFFRFKTKGQVRAAIQEVLQRFSFEKAENW